MTLWTASPNTTNELFRPPPPPPKMSGVCCQWQFNATFVIVLLIRSHVTRNNNSFCAWVWRSTVTLSPHDLYTLVVVVVVVVAVAVAVVVFLNTSIPPQFMVRDK